MLLPAPQEHFHGQRVEAHPLARQAHFALVDDGHRGQEHRVGGEFAQISLAGGGRQVSGARLGLLPG